MPRSVTSPYRLSRTSVTARVIAIIVFLAGAVNIFSAWLGIDPARVRLLHVYPLLPGLLPGPHSSRTLTVLAGVLLMLLSSSLFWRKRQGWIAAVVLLTLSLVLHLLKGLDYEEATFTIVVLSVLIVARHEFVVRSDRRSFRSAALISVVMVAGSLCYGVLGYALLRPHFTPAFTLHRALDSTIVALIQTGSPALRPRQVVVKPAPVPRGHGSGHRAHANSAAPARPKIEADKDAVWFDDSLVGIAFISVLLIAGALLRPVAATLLEMESEREEVRRLLVEYGGATLGYWALLPGLSYLFLPSRRAVLAYRVEEHVALVLGDPIGDADAIPELIAMFDQLCLLNDWRPAWYQLTARWLPGMRAHGWAALKLGEEALIPLPALSFSGKAWQDVRTALHRLPREGCGALWYDLLSDPRGWIPELQAISQSWLDAHHGDERGFSQGTWETAIRYAEEQRVLVLVDGDGRPAAFLTFVPLFIEGGGWALDLMRRRHSLCPGAVEYLLAFALQSFQEEGVASVSLGLSALSDVTPSEAGSSPELVNRARALIFEHFDRLYNFKGLHQFKEKFQPEWEARFLVYPSLAQLPRVLLALIRAHTVVSSTRRPRVQLPVSNIMMVHACSGIASLSAGMARAWARTPWRRQSAGARDRLAGLGLGLPIAAAHGPSTAPALLHCGQLVEMILITLLSLWILLLLARHGRDVRAARRAARERRLPDIFAHAPQAILILDPVQHRLLEANPAAVQLLGYSQQALLELRYEDLVADAGDAVQSDIPADLSVGTPLAFTRTFRNCGGEEVSLKITGAVFPYQDTEALLMFLHDLTEFKHVDVRRDSERRRLFAVLDALPAYVYLLAPDHSIRFANRCFREQIGDPASASSCQLLCASPAPCASCEAALVLDTQKPRTHIWSSPSGRIYQQFDYPFDDTDGSMLVLATGVDITERTQIEEQLHLAKEHADAASLAKSRFLAHMSHEIRTPLNAIIGMADLLLETAASAEQREGLQVVISSADTLLSILNDVLDFAKIEAGKLELEITSFSLRSLVDDLMQLFSLRAHKKGLALSYVVAPRVPDAVTSDPVRLRQVLINLLSNALKFTEQGAVTLLVDKVEGDAHEVRLRFAVHDTGIGIPADRQAAIFEAFAQSDSSMTRRFGGTGLGLAISNQLVILLGSAIQVDSTPGEGSTFHFTVPLGVALTAPAALVPAAEPASDQAPGHAPGEHALRILLAEDNQVNQQVAVRMLEKRGHQVVIAADGRQAVSCWEHMAFDLILMDIQMPTLNGLAATEEIRTRERDTGEHIPIIAMTAYATQGDVTACLQAGMDDYLSKPIKSLLLLSTIERVLAQGTGSVSPRSQTADAPFELERALANVEGDWGLLGELAHIFTREWPSRMAGVQQALQQGDVDTAHLHAHALKGSISHFAANAAWHSAVMLEQRLKAGDLTEMESALHQVEQECLRLTHSLEAISMPAPNDAGEAGTA